MTNTLPPLEAEWLEADGLGGFASGTVSGIRTRRYHALLLPATIPPAGRMLLVNGFDAWIDIGGQTIALTSQKYAPDVTYPDGATCLEGFTRDPWPQWTWKITDTLRIEHELFCVHGRSAVCLSWKVVGNITQPISLRLRPFLSGRDFHSTHHENSAFDFNPTESFEHVVWHPYQDVPAIVTRSNGRYVHEPRWYRNFLYSEEQSRGLDAIEDLASPGTFHWDLTNKPAVLVLATDGHRLNHLESTEELYLMVRRAERIRREAFSSPLHRAADAYLVRRGKGRSIIAGYPWFGDWGRDTFIAMRGLCLATGRLEEARDILVEWADTVSQGMLPNRFPDQGESPEFNSVDASLWYVIAVHEYLRAIASERPASFASDCHTQRLYAAVEAILDGYSTGTRFGIRADDDGLLACGEPGSQLTWMDARVDGHEITPRIGKPVEVQALWINALWIGLQTSSRWESLFEQARANFERRFWNSDEGFLFDVIDCDHRRGVNDSSLRPNQILAVGGLPLALLDGDRARKVVDSVERTLLTPLGLRSLAPGHSQYMGHYNGGVAERDGAYHQGTVWPWLMGPFVEAWLRVRGGTPEARKEAAMRFLAPLLIHLSTAGLGHVSEIADSEPPYTPRGCPFQAWSLGELIRLEKLLQ